jgi:predicted ArsR family transcriptional regulator
MIDDDEILDVLRESDDPFLGSSEVAGPLDIGREGTLKRLNELEAEGRVKKKKVGNVLIWWLPDE